MKNAFVTSSMFVGIFFLTGCGQQPVNSTETTSPVIINKPSGDFNSEGLNNETSSKINPLPNTTILIEYNGIKVNAIIDRPESKEVDVLLAYHGTAMNDSKVIEVAKSMLEKTKKIVKKNNVMIISVAYREEGMLFGDNIKEAETALLWTKYKASTELGVKINRIFLIGHSQGGYLVTRLNTMHETSGVIANGAGPIDLGFRCQLDESGKIRKTENRHGQVCSILKNEYGSVFDNSIPYTERSMISFVSGYKSKILFVQGMLDSKIQMEMWPKFKEKLNQCTDCAEYKFLEIENSGHGAMFEDGEVIKAVNNFLAD